MLDRFHNLGLKHIFVVSAQPRSKAWLETVAPSFRPRLKKQWPSRTDSPELPRALGSFQTNSLAKAKAFDHLYLFKYFLNNGSNIIKP